MPIAISPARARELRPLFDEALELVFNEFEGLDSHRQYRNAFARLLKTDPLGRVLMMGTDQRDMFVPELRRIIQAHVPGDGHIFDFGAGDGQTFALVAASVPRGTRVSIEEPNADYLRAYSAFLSSQDHLRSGTALEAGFDDLDSTAQAREHLPADGSVDLALALHMIYFVKDVTGSLTRMLRFLKPGGALFVVAADETVGYTGVVLNSFIQTGGDTGANAEHLSKISERRRILGSPAESGEIPDILEAAGVPVEIRMRRQPSRLYGHTIADLIALSTIAALSGVEDLSRFETAAALLRDRPDAVDLRIEDDGPRVGMWSVTQPQWVTVFRRVGPRRQERSGTGVTQP
jgi:SAM-dependent methyltransferase